MLQAYQFFVDEELEQEKRAKKKQLELEAKEVLDAQVRARREREQREKSDEKAHMDELMEQLNRVQADKDERNRLLKEKNDREKKAFEDQLAAEKQRKKQEADEAVRKEKELYEAYLRQAAEEKEQEKRRKQAEHERQLRLIEENEADKKLREAKRLAEIAEDQRMNKEYADKLDREAREREGAFAIRMEKLKKFAEQVDNGPILQAKREEEERLEKIRQRDIKAKYDADLKRELDDAARRRSQRQQMQRENARQIEEKNRTAALERLSDNELGKKFLAESSETRRLEQERRRLEAEARRIYGSKLLRQINTKSDSQKEKDDMIERERRYNSQNLRAIVDDTKTYDKICGHLKLSLSQKYENLLLTGLCIY
jgi:hypothetical protein